MKLIELEQNTRIESKALKLKYFDKICAEIPESVIIVQNVDNCHPRWGFAWYVKGQNGEIELFKENWDTSG